MPQCSLATTFPEPEPRLTVCPPPQHRPDPADPEFIPVRVRNNAQLIQELTPRKKFRAEIGRANSGDSLDRLLGLAALWGVNRRELAVRTRLHLPRYADPDGTVGRLAALAVVVGNASRLRRDQRAVRDLMPRREHALADLEFRLIGPEADRIFSSLHYLRNARRGSLNFALVDKQSGRPLTLCSVSPLEWKRVADLLTLQFGVPRTAIWDVSRVYSFDGAPANAVSYLLSRVRRFLRKRGDVELLTTVVDPNLGFTGASYLASNWQQWMTVQARPYLYYKRRYMSLRQMWAAFPSVRSIDELCALDRRARRSSVELQDSLIFCCRVRGATEWISPAERSRVLR